MTINKQIEKLSRDVEKEQKTVKKNSKEITHINTVVEKNSKEIIEIKARINEKVPRPSVKMGNIEISLRKSYIDPVFTNKTVLTDSTWHYVELFLKRQKGNQIKDALNYWNQAKNFFNATGSLDLSSKPLTSYYCFLNATKALLTYKKIAFDNNHGVSGESVKDASINILNEQISMHPKGVLSGLCVYLKEPIKTVPVEGKKKPLPESYTLRDILYNLPYIHRAYNLTFPSQAELFIPIDEPRFVFDKNRKVGWLELQLEPSYSTRQQFVKTTGFGIDNYYGNSDYYTLRVNKSFYWHAPRNKPDEKSLEEFIRYYEKHRRRFRYIYSANELWYIKRTNLKNGIIDRNTLSLTFAAMHRLSEMSRYDPNTLEEHLVNKSGWLLSEFITKSIYQFIDMISSEITGDDFRITGFRT